MEKNLKKGYRYLDLAYSATIDEIEARKVALIKMLKAKERDKNISCEKEIFKVENSANILIENIKNNGIPKEYHHFIASNESIVGLVIVFMFAVVVCFFSFYAFL